ncbi:MAG: DUF2680 domain-containing protein [Saccharofermentanales bacterium]
MTKAKKFVIPVVLALAIGAISFTAFAASSYKSPAEVAAALTGKSVDEVTAQKSEEGTTYGSIADEAGKLEEFKAEMLELKKDILTEKVEAGTLTQERADEILAAIEENMANCDGTGSGRTGEGMGAGFGFGKGNGQGRGQGMRNGQGGGMRNGGNCTAATPNP